MDSHIERELPKVRELRELLERNCQDLAALGMERTTTGQIRIYLTQISADFHGLVRAGIDGDYGGRDADFFNVQGKKFTNRLRAVVHLENEKFANHMREYGHTRKVVNQEEDQPFESADQTMELSLSEEGQILVSKEGMATWVKEVSGKPIDCRSPSNHTRSIIGREAGNYPEIITTPFWQSSSIRSQ